MRFNHPPQFQAGIRKDKADAPSSIFERQLLIPFSRIPEAPKRVKAKLSEVNGYRPGTLAGEYFDALPAARP